MFTSIELIILVFKIEDEDELELKTPESMKLFGSTKKLIDKTKNGEKVLEVVEVVLVQFNLVFNLNISKSLKHCTPLLQVNLTLIC